MMSKDKNKGFTLIELLVVISIIASLAGLSYVALGGARRQAHVIRVGSDVKNITIAMAATLKKQGRTSWWTESELGLGVNPKVADIPGLKDFLNNIPRSPIPGTGDYLYDNDGDILGDNEADEKGVNIMLIFPNDNRRDEYFELIDKLVEQGNGPSLGRVRSSPGSIIIFNISPDPSRLGF